MEQSEFTPPARQSLTDEQISQQLGSAKADEAGMLAAMDFLEAQTNLRAADNAAMESWISRMKESQDPRAAIALENLDRSKQGLEPLPISESVSPEQPATQFDQLLGGSAEEAAEVFEEKQVDDSLATEIDELVHETGIKGLRLASASNWVLGIGILAPALGASFAAINGLNFVTSILAGVVGILVGVKVNLLALLTARRTNRGLAVASRSTFGVFGAIVPGLLVLVAAVFAVGTFAFGAGKFLNNTVVGLPGFETKLLELGSSHQLTVGALAVVVLVLVPVGLAIFGGKTARVLKISLAAILLVGFVAVAGLTVSGIDYLNLAGNFELNGFLIVAPVFALLVSVLTYGLDGDSLSIASWGASRARLGWPVLIFGFLLPMLTYGHIAALLNGHEFKSAESVVTFLLRVGKPIEIASTLLVDLSIVAVIGLIYLGVSRLIEALKTLGLNHIGYGSAVIVALTLLVLTAVESVLAPDALSLNGEITSLLLIPSGAWLGALLTETVMRRGKYHDASLTRSYGFYGAFNWLALITFVLSVVFALSITQTFGSVNFVGFLSSTIHITVSPTLAALIAMGTSVIFTLAVGFPAIIRQQRETKAIADRQYDLLDVVAE